MIKDFLKENKIYVAAYCMFVLAYPIASVVLPSYYGQIIDDLKENKNPPIKITVFLMVFVTIMFRILDEIDAIFMPKLQIYVRMNIVKAILHTYKDKFQEQDLGSLIATIVKLPIVIREIVWGIRTYLIPLISTTVCSIIKLLLIHPPLGYMTIGIIIMIISVFYPNFNRCVKYSSSVDADHDILHESISDLFDNLVNIYSMNMSEKEIEKLEKHQYDIITKGRESSKCAVNLKVAMNTFTTVIFLCLILYTYYLFKQKKLGIKDMISITITLMYIIDIFTSFFNDLPDMTLNIGIYNKINHYIKKFNAMSPTKQKNIKVNKGDIKFKNIGIKYGDKKIIENFNLNIKPQEKISIVGKIGCGKSTLIKALMKLKELDEGQILVDDVDIKNVDSMSLRSSMLLVQQNPIPFNRSLYENIVYGNEGVTKEEVLSLFNKYDLSSLFGNTKLDDIVGRKGENLSGGQRQAIFLLRILLSNDKKIIILDEPTSSLDENSSVKILKLLKDVMMNRTVIVITHNNALNEYVDRVIRLD